MVYEWNRTDQQKSNLETFCSPTWATSWIFSTGASNLRPRNIFVRPKLDPEFKEKSVFWPIFLRFLTDCGPKYEKKAYLRPKDQLKLDAPDLVYGLYDLGNEQFFRPSLWQNLAEFLVPWFNIKFAKKTAQQRLKNVCQMRFKISEFCSKN